MRSPRSALFAGWGPTRRTAGGIIPRLVRAAGSCRCQRWNGPAEPPQRRRPVAGGPGMVGHKLSANGLPYRTACSARPSPWFAALRGRPWRGNRHISDSRVIPSAHPLPFRLRAIPSDLAACPGRQTPLGGKVRWQKRFASPARRMKRGLQSLKTINSRKFITNAKTSTPWRGPFITAASPASCPVCNRPLSM